MSSNETNPGEILIKDRPYQRFSTYFEGFDGTKMREISQSQYHFIAIVKLV